MVSRISVTQVYMQTYISTIQHASGSEKMNYKSNVLGHLAESGKVDSGFWNESHQQSGFLTCNDGNEPTSGALSGIIVYMTSKKRMKLYPLTRQHPSLHA
jgi:hypothetical protein